MACWSSTSATVAPRHTTTVWLKWSATETHPDRFRRLRFSVPTFPYLRQSISVFWTSAEQSLLSIIDEPPNAANGGTLGPNDASYAASVASSARPTPKGNPQDTAGRSSTEPTPSSAMPQLITGSGIGPICGLPGDVDLWVQPTCNGKVMVSPYVPSPARGTPVCPRE
ncbi:hypothetical protein CONLIGDRAFT_649844 [Coniochaeta ligniaria NRRL 30616]|uniref:Uncharacterized protein n=1 Tax=Coniochaeta ligniaria NRRL 30616 TaxID=1408157 RepID=A0A1J7I6Q9_9PEZI|nr:hypothetical protein CONLIGDRAFT_649844 [Coniochaeta ligniaria NRRL 30616]